MRLEHEPEKLLKEKILEVLGEYIKLADFRVFFFGSRVNGGGDNRSDIDVGIQGTMPIPLDVLGDIQEELEDLDTLYKIDVVDFAAVSDRFKQVAMEQTEIIN